MTDLVCLVADKNIEAALAGLLDRRRESLGLRRLVHEITVHQRRDPGCYHGGPEMLRGLLGAQRTRGLLVFDQAWKGNPHASAAETEGAIRGRFQQLGISDRAEVVVLDPEIEAWVWSRSPHVDDVLGWRGATPTLRRWLRERDLWPEGHGKPADPKAAMERALYERRIPRSSSLYRQLAERVSLTSCQDAAFDRLCQVLRTWFPAAEGGEA